MTVKINDREYRFDYRGFGPLYTYEMITGEVFRAGSMRSLHVLLYATLLNGNREEFAMGLEEFFEWLYDHPEEEQAMAQAVGDEFSRRNELAAATAKKK